MVYKGGSTPKTQTEVQNKLLAVYGDKYDFSNSVYHGSKKPLSFVCSDHGEVTIKAERALNGFGCPECGKAKGRISKRLGREEIIKRCREAHGLRYDYSKVSPERQEDIMTLMCSKHGEFKIPAVNHFMGSGCKQCGYVAGGRKLANTTAEFIARARDVHGFKYHYDKTEYVNMREQVLITCEKHGDFSQMATNHLGGKGCRGCGYKNPKAETEISNFLHGLGIRHDMNRRGLIDRLELDIYIPEHNLAIEHNGLYWHSTAHKDRLYHIQKRDMCEAKGIRLLQILEDEWLYRQDAIKSVIKSALGLNEKVYARQTEVVETDISDFLDAHHHAGNVRHGKGYALVADGEIVMAMSLRKWLEGRTVLDGWEIARVASSKTVVGGFSKLLAHVKRELIPTKLTSFCDLRLFTGESYTLAGFKFIRQSEPTGWWIKALERKHPRSFTKDKVAKIFGEYPTAKAGLEANGWRQMYDCGHNRYEWSLNLDLYA